jgi:FkbM family methyltransferase
MSFSRSGARTVLALAKILGMRLRPLSSSDKLSGIQIIWREDESILRGSVSSFSSEGQHICMFIENEFDLIQRCHIAGHFYEPEELSIIKRHFRGGTFVDVGANVGNHSVYASKIMGADRIVAVEPNPDAYRILELNLLLNGLSDRSCVHRVGLAKAEGAASMSVPEFNLGKAKLDLSSPGGGLQVVKGDTILAEEVNIGMIKIDTEGLELDVLAGLKRTIDGARPPMFIEVDNANMEMFREFCETEHYETVEEFRRYDTSLNLMIRPVT